MKAWVVAASFGNEGNGVIVAGHWMAELAEIAGAQVIAQYYTAGGNLPLIGVSVKEMTSEFLEEALRVIRGPAAKPAVVPMAGWPGPETVCNYYQPKVIDPGPPIPHPGSSEARRAPNSPQPDHTPDDAA